MTDPLLWTLIALQISMGAFDTLVHHEGTERLAWRPSQQTELRLHGVRNAFYAVIFLCLGWFEPHGTFTIALTIILGLEVLITLWDFVEEDLTRRLPATERVNHTLLALNYGAILALAAPYLWTWSALPSAMVPVYHGGWSIMATLAAIGVALFSARDLVAAARSTRLNAVNATSLVAQLAPRQHLLITGGTGFIGQRLVEALVAGGHHVTVLTRNLQKVDALTHPVRLIASLKQIDNTERFDAIVNLAGEPVANAHWTPRKRARILQSRVKMTKDLVALIRRLDQKPSCLITGSAVGWYGLRQDETLTEDDTHCPAFIHEVCDTWERAAAPVVDMGVRVVQLRIGLVLGVEGGMLARMLTPFEFGAGCQLGNGQQWMPWIERDDLIRVIAFAMSHPDINGPLNATAPNPVRNAEFTQALASALNRAALIRLPAWLITNVAGDMGRETILGGQRVIPAKLLRSGFRFNSPELAPALARITGARAASNSVSSEKRRA